MKASVQEQATAAAENYRRKYPEASTEQMQAITANILDGINKASTRRKYQDREARHARRIAVNQKVADAGVKLFYYRGHEVRNQRRQGSQITAEVSIVPTGGLTFAVKAEEGNPAAQIAFTFCHENENFDYVMARETVMDRYLNGTTYPVPAALVTPQMMRNEHIRRVLTDIALSLLNSH